MLYQHPECSLERRSETADGSKTRLSFVTQKLFQKKNNKDSNIINDEQLNKNVEEQSRRGSTPLMEGLDLSCLGKEDVSGGFLCEGRDLHQKIHKSLLNPPIA